MSKHGRRLSQRTLTFGLIAWTYDRGPILDLLQQSVSTNFNLDRAYLKDLLPSGGSEASFLDLSQKSPNTRKNEFGLMSEGLDL